MRITHLLHRLLFLGTCLVVWRNHGKAIRHGGLSFEVYWRRCRQEFGAASKLMDPKSYAHSPRSG